MTAQRELEAVLQEAVELKVDMSIPDDAKKALEEVKEMHVRWEGEHKAKEESVACRAAEEEALCKGKELAHSDGGEHANNEAVCLFNDNASPTHEVEEEEKEPMPVVKLMAKPAPVKWIEFCVMRAMPASSPSVHGSTHSMEVMIHTCTT